MVYCMRKIKKWFLRRREKYSLSPTHYSVVESARFLHEVAGLALR